MGCGQSPKKNYIYNVLENSEMYEKEKLINVNNLSNTSGPYLNRNIKDFKLEVEEYYKNRTLLNEFMTNLHKHKNNKCLGYRKIINADEIENKFTFFSYDEIFSMSEIFSKNIIKHNLTVKNYFENEGDFQFMGIYSKNCVEWVITDLACQMNSLTSVTLYATLGEQAFENICNETELTTLCVSPDNISSLLKYKQKLNLKTLKNIILYDLTQNIDNTILKTQLEIYGYQVILFSDLLQKNIELDNIPLCYSKPDTVLTICYTSGTTALPKGAQITQRNFASQLDNIENLGIEMNHKSSHLSYLPLAHIMERLIISVILNSGSSAGMITGDVRKYLREDLEILRPTLLVTVPRVLNLFRQTIFDGIEKLPKGCKRNSIEKAIKVKKENLTKYGKINHFFYDKAIFSKIRAKFGGKIQAIITGSAPLNKDLADDIKVIFGVPIIEGYGMTETTGGIAATHKSDTTNLNAGGCIRAGKIKLIDIPEMNYHSRTMLNEKLSPTGEICTYGPHIFKGYFRNQEETQKAIDSNGWLHTGDVGRIMPDDKGLKIIDRVKEIFKLSQGEYIAPCKLESVYSKCKYVAQICIVGSSIHNFIIAIIVPNIPNIIEFLKSKGKNDNIENYFRDEELLNEIKNSLLILANENNFNSLEKISKFIISSKEMNIENGCLTPTLKLVRRKIENEFKEKIEKIYNSK